jgi:hypothetical protein
VLVALVWRSAALEPRHRPVAAVVVGNLIADVVRRGLALLNAPAYAAAHGAPLTGLGRALFHADEALFLAWPFGLAALAALVFLEEPHRRRVAALVGSMWGLSSLALALAYPMFRGPALGRVYLAVELTSLAAIIASGWSWWQRWEKPSLVEGSVIILGTVELGAVIQWSPFGKGWDAQVTSYLVGYATLILFHGGELWGPSKSRSLRP